ncbi:MAG TPA: alanine--tRNA ligase, partial [Planctomycetota bacterium]|nr:alanine--tRNA ligase [Planctomycetota bacterium]
MKTDEIRERYLKFFEARGHARYPSDSLVPSNDPSLLFTSAGMAQFKDMFLGIGKLPHKRITTCQRCLRVGDLENVGRTARHHTFFEMLGNFSFGDYFKAEAIPWCWEFYTGDLGIPAEKLWVSIYEKDDEAEAVWKKLGKLKHPIVKMGEADNFWPANAPSQGPNGPCGPCSEIFYDFGDGPWWCGKCTEPGHSCDRFVEIGNIVFTQYERQKGGILKPLPQKNIDFGGGLERVAAVMQGVHSNYEIDIFRAIIAEAAKVLEMRATSENGRRFRRIADHIRALTFCIADGVRPSNEGRGYVVRRILRTAFRDGWKLRQGAKLDPEPFLHKVVGAVVDQMKAPYPFLVERRKDIQETILNEEKQFLRTIERGMSVVEGKVEELKKARKNVLDGKDAFDLYQSHGFPVELTIDVLGDYGMTIDVEGFKKALQEEQDRARTSEAIFDPNSPLTKIKEQKVPVTEFLGYGIRVADIGKPVDVRILRVVKLDPESLAKFNESKKDMAQVTKLIGKGTLVDSAKEGDAVAVLCDRTPFYADGGGQVGDAGWIRTPEAEVEISDTRKPDGYFFHLGRVAKGTLRPGPATAQVDAQRRLNIMRNHTGTHLLHAALRAVLGPHVTQAGSVVEPDRLRFDFTHPKGVTIEERRKIEDWVNRIVFEDREVTKAEMTMEEAKAKGALMFFGDKYGDRVRVVSVGDAESVELCGGTHLEHAATIGALRITSESAIGSGVRRVEAVTGPGVVEAARKQEDLLLELARRIGCPVQDIPRRIKQLADDVQELKSEVGRLRRGGGGANGVDALVQEARDIGDEKVVAARLDSGKVDDARALMDELTKKRKIGAAILAVPGERPAFVIGVREDLVKSKGLKAGEIAKEVGKACGGGGGGREFQAQAGASDASKIQLGFDTFEAAVRA